MAKRTRRGRPVSPHAAHRRIASDLRRRMGSGEWPPGTVLPPWRQLARQYRVGVRAIQLATTALKRDGLLGTTPHLRLVVRDQESPGTALDQGLLVLLTTAPHLYLGNSMTNALMLGILKGAGELNLPLQISYDERLRHKVPAELLERPLRGVVIAGKISAAALRGWEQAQVSAALADHPGRAWKLHAAGVDNAQATEESVRRMLALGHRRIAFVRRMHTHGVHDVEPDSRERQEVFLSTLRKAGLRGGDSSIISFFSRDTSSAPGIAALFRHSPRFTAVLAADLGCAEFIRQAAQVRGITVPHDLSLVAFGPLDPQKSFFSGFRFDFSEIGRASVHLAAGPRRPPKQVRIPGTWWEGKSLSRRA